jgi:hypothetical protein
MSGPHTHRFSQKMILEGPQTEGLQSEGFSAHEKEGLSDSLLRPPGTILSCIDFVSKPPYSILRTHRKTPKKIHLNFPAIVKTLPETLQLISDPTGFKLRPP